jgi:hypothetical protein
MRVVTESLSEAKRHINGKTIFKVAVNPRAGDDGINNSVSRWESFDNFKTAQEYFHTSVNQLHAGDKIIMNWYIVDNTDANIVLAYGKWAWDECRNKNKERKNLFLTIIFSILGIILGLILILGFLHLR